MAWEFHVGQRVVCIKVGQWDDPHPDYEHEYPKYGEVYTIADMGIWDGDVWLRLREVNIPWSEEDYESCFWAGRFRPLRERKTSIECFRALLNPTEKKVEA